MISLEKLTKAIQNADVFPREEDCRKDAIAALKIFGRKTEIADNVLESEDRGLCYFLEGEGLLRTRKTRRGYYWVLDKEAIDKLAKKKRRPPS